MKIISKSALAAAIISLLIAQAAAFAQTPAAQTYRNIELLEPSGSATKETSVRVEFCSDSMVIIGGSGRAVLKEMKYADITAAEYSYTKKPRWKTGLGLGAAAFVFPALFLIAIPIGFSKHRRHWVTVRTGNDFAVLKVGKGIRKIFIPAFETRSGVRITALGDDK